MVALPKGRLHQFNIITETIIKQQNDEGFLHRLPDETEFPLLDFFETINDFVIKVDLPGIDKKDVNYYGTIDTKHRKITHLDSTAARIPLDEKYDLSGITDLKVSHVFTGFCDFD